MKDVPKIPKHGVTTVSLGITMLGPQHSFGPRSKVSGLGLTSPSIAVP